MVEGAGEVEGLAWSWARARGGEDPGADNEPVEVAGEIPRTAEGESKCNVTDRRAKGEVEDPPVGAHEARDDPLSADEGNYIVGGVQEDEVRGERDRRRI